MPKRRTRSTTRSRGPAPDWVYRPNARTLATGSVNNDALGTYEPNFFTVVGGVGNAQSRILYDSKNYVAMVTRGGAGSALTLATVGVMGSSGRAEGKKACIRRVEGVILTEPTTWALGSVMAMGVRMGIFEQDVATGTFSLDASYSMWFNPAALADGPPASFANNRRNNAWEVRQWRYFGDASSNPNMVIRINWTGRKYLEGNECFGMYLELPAVSTSLRTQCWVRSLVIDEG